MTSLGHVYGDGVSAPSTPGELAALRPAASALASLREASLDRAYVSLGSRRTTSPHEFYRYPARFSPTFARAAIEAFTRPGELVIDPFVGGGTTLVEAMAAKRRSLGTDLNSLATFVSSVKSRPLSRQSLAAVQSWIETLPTCADFGARGPAADRWANEGYLKDLDDELTGPLRVTIEHELVAASRVRPRSAEYFARCVILRTAQWALDMRTEVPSAEEFQIELRTQAASMLGVAHQFAKASVGAPRPKVLTQGLPGLADRPEVREAPALVLTSPPYPGVYVLYHRWKLRGRREIPAPYWIADRLDGHGLARYTMHARSDATQNTYFEKLEAAFADIARLSSPATWLVQIVGFNGGQAQFERYLGTMESAGFREAMFPELATDNDGRLWRPVPNRRWWTEATSLKSVAVHTSREVVLFHRLMAKSRRPHQEQAAPASRS